MEAAPLVRGSSVISALRGAKDRGGGTMFGLIKLILRYIWLAIIIGFSLFAWAN
jgi:hypothetical protein